MSSIERFRCERIGDAVIYQGDCREILPLLYSVAAVVTDPPYCSGGFSESAKQAAKGMGLRGVLVQHWERPAL